MTTTEDSELIITEATGILHEILVKLKDLKELLVREARIQNSQIINPEKFTELFKEKTAGILDDLVILEREYGTKFRNPQIEELSGPNNEKFRLEKSWALIKDVGTSCANYGIMAGPLRNSIMIGNIRGALERLKLLEKNVDSAMKIINEIFAIYQTSKPFSKMPA
ncbi:hypothetical protein HY483_03995 [Candidatus Woesearchaeota archaeon]|nr:hypothetical protein [Candidatus Woesearchaeota archaeon]